MKNTSIKLNHLNQNHKARKWFIPILALMLILPMSIGLLGQVTQAQAAEPVNGNYYISDYETKEEALAKANLLNEEIYGEGVTMLKNEDNALPLPFGAKISLFGKNSLRILQSGTGSSSGSGSSNVSMQVALQNAGFQINPTLINFYNDNTASGPGRGVAPSNGNVPSGYNTGETPISMYTSSVESSYANYSDAAIVVFQRIAGEGFDLPRTMTWNGSSYGTWSTDQVVPGARNADDHYLQLDLNESDLLKYLGDHFDKVIVLLNTGSQFEVGFLDDPTHYGYHENIKAALWIGYPGGNGLNALGKMLKGQINPSGRLSDTYARNFKEDPSWMNFGNNLENFGNQYVNLPSSGGHGGGGYRNNYVYYEEGIYVGYRYYETRGFTDGEAWYKDAVVYPFGHGLSYTTFTQEIVTQIPTAGDSINEDSVIEVTVKVTNTGTVAGKEVVQLYYTTPYITGEIEKSHVVLGSFGKTRILQPGESQNIILTLKARDMASYDFNDANHNGFKGYELDPGTYTIRIMKNAHEEFESYNLLVDQNIQITTDDASNNEIENRFDDVSNEISTYLSRADWVSTFPTTELKIQASEMIQTKVLEWLSNNPADEGQPYFTNVMPTVGNDTGTVKLNDLIGLDYEDPLWDTFLNQLSVETMKSLAGRGSYRSGLDMPSLGITQAINADSPAGWVNWSYGTSGGVNTLYTSDTVLAATFNKELAYQKGLMIGNEALFGNGGLKSRYAGWYAPGVNIHRSPFGGRNFEYFSEDGYLTGSLAAQIVKGVQEKGVFPYVKHFGVNEQETYRVGIMTWASEQSMREIYLKGFEITVKEGKTRGIMSSLNRIGTVWAGGSYPLLTEILRNEWNFKGTVVTDSYLGGYSNINQMIRAGGDLALGDAYGSINYNVSTPTTVANLRRASHNILYTHANSLAMNTGYSAVPPALSNYDGGLLEVGIVDVSYNISVATVKVNPEIFGDGVTDDMVEYRIKMGYQLPQGLTLGLDGTISGVPQVDVNNHQFVVVASYGSYSREAIFTLSISPSNGAIIYQPTTQPPVAIIGQVYEFSLATAHIFKPDATPTEIEQFPPIYYSIKNGDALPDGLSLSSDGILSGKPKKQIEDYEFTVVASTLGFKDTETVWKISIYNLITFETKTLKQGQFGQRYLDQISLAQSENPVTYSLANGSSLPQGLTLTPSGIIIGQPNEVVTNHEFAIVATSDFAEPVEATYSITIGIAYNKVSMKQGVVNQNYDAIINTAQGTKNITYELKSDSKLPEGLSLTADGRVVGQPKESGLFTFTVSALAEGFEGDEITLSLFIDNAPESNNDLVNMILGGFGTLIVLSTIGGVLIFKRKKIL